LSTNRSRTSRSVSAFEEQGRLFLLADEAGTAKLRRENNELPEQRHESDGQTQNEPLSYW